MYKPIILIGGTAGTGKTTLSRELGDVLKIDHRLGTGFIREVIRAETSPEKDPCLYEYTFRAVDPVAHLVSQAQRIYPAVIRCIERARHEGTSLIVEGNHLLPELYTTTCPDLFAVLSAPDVEEHLKRLQGETHVNRTILTADVQNIRCIDALLKQECQNHKVLYLQYKNNLDQFVELIHGARKTQ